jgi:hypothetical protein
MAQRLLPLAEPALELVSLGLGAREGLLQFANTIVGLALLLPLRCRAGNREQRSGGEAERQDVIECIEEIAAANAEHKQEQRRSAENGDCGVDEPACGPRSRAVHGPVAVPRDGRV